jgi:DNA-binding GntR family transcriptional regulator
MPVPQSEATLDRDLLRDRAYAALRDAIVDGTLAPGERLKDAELTRWLGLSRTPVREALARLEQDGLVETAPQRFTRVTPLDRRAARDAFPLVATLHALAAELAVPRLTASDYADMLEANDRFATALRAAHAGPIAAEDDAERFPRARDAAPIAAGSPRPVHVEAALTADDDFHAVFVRASANVELPRVLDRLMPGVRRLERLRFGSLPGRASVRQHAEIVRLASAGDAAATAASVRENWLSLGALIDRTFIEEAT